MSDFYSSFDRESKYLEDMISKDVAYFYTKYISPDSTGNNYSVTRLTLSDKEKSYIDFTQGYFLNQLTSQPDLSRYDVLEAQIKDNISQFYDNVNLVEGIAKSINIPEKYINIFNEQKNEAMQTTTNAILKELNNCIIRGKPAFSVLNSVNSVIEKRVNALKEFMKSICRQLNQYMLLYLYKRLGCDRYLFITEGANCDWCEYLKGNIYKIEDATSGFNLPPIHPNCDCSIAILDKDNNIKAVLRETLI